MATLSYLNITLVVCAMVAGFFDMNLAALLYAFPAGSEAGRAWRYLRSIERASA